MGDIKGAVGDVIVLGVASRVMKQAAPRTRQKRRKKRRKR